MPYEEYKSKRIEEYEELNSIDREYELQEATNRILRALGYDDEVENE